MKCLRKFLSLSILSLFCTFSVDLFAMMQKYICKDGVLPFYIEKGTMYNGAPQFLLFKNSLGVYSVPRYLFNQWINSIKYTRCKSVAYWFYQEVKYFDYSELIKCMNYKGASCTIHNKQQNQETIFLLNCSGTFKNKELFIMGICRANGCRDYKLFTYEELLDQYKAVCSREKNIVDASLLNILFGDEYYNLTAISATLDSIQEYKETSK